MFLQYKFQLKHPCDSDILDKAVDYCKIVQCSSKYDVLRFLNKSVITRYVELQTYTDLIRKITDVDMKTLADNQIVVFKQICKESASDLNDSLMTFNTIYTTDKIEEFTKEAQLIIDLIDKYQYDIYEAIDSDKKEYQSKLCGDNYKIADIVIIVLSIIVTIVFWFF